MIQRLMWEKSGIIRSGTSLINAKEQIKIIEEEYIPKIYGSKTKEIWDAISTININTVANLVITSSIERKESRGSFYRTDYKNLEKKWIKHISLRKKVDKIDIKSLPIHT